MSLTTRRHKEESCSTINGCLVADKLSFLSLEIRSCEIGPLRIDVTVTAKWPLWALRNVTPFTPSHFRQSRKERLPGHLTAYAEVWLGSVPERTSSMNSRSQSNSTALRLPRPQTEILKSTPFWTAYQLKTCYHYHTCQLTSRTLGRHQAFSFSILLCRSTFTISHPSH